MGTVVAFALRSIVTEKRYQISLAMRNVCAPAPLLIFLKTQNRLECANRSMMRRRISD